jgi:hypothetical protein
MNSIKNIFKLSGLNLLKHKKIEKRDNFWFNNPFILIDPNRLDEFFPSKVMTLEEQINAMIRLLGYISVFLMLYSGNSNYLYLLIFALIISYVVYKYSDSISVGKVKKEDFMSNYDSNKNYILPTMDNPFMNVQYDDYIKNPDREAISKLNNYKNPNLEKLIEEKFNYNLYKDVSDIFSKNNSQRQFYTTPVTTIPNDQKSFANWLYKTPPTCKENNGNQCVANNYYNLKQNSSFKN